MNQLVIESRGPAADRKDARTVGRALRADRASTDLVHEHRRPTHDSGLWLADALAGAAATALTGRTEYRDQLAEVLERIVIDV